jgi:DNA-binding NtrC family response regulator
MNESSVQDDGADRSVVTSASLDSPPLTSSFATAPDSTVESEAQPLHGKHVLVADDEFLIAVVIEEMLKDAGSEVVSAGTVLEALQGASDELLSGAVLDVRLGNKTTEIVADALSKRMVPFIFYSGEPLPQRIRDKHPDATVLHKPVSLDTLLEALLKAMRH